MHDASDMDLLRDYARQGSEEVFAELVRRHINLVYSAALRHVGIAAHAEEITQAVFVILARKAVSLRTDTVLDAWLYETTRLTALSFLRGERRRQFREQEAYMQSTLPESTDVSVWNQLAPLLDDAMARLGKKDREAVVLRYFKEKNLGEVAAAMKITEAAAQSRVHRAVEKLRGFFTKRGVTLSVSVLAGVVSANSVQAAPIGLSVTIAATSVKGSAVAASTLTLVKATLKIMTYAKLKLALGIAAATLFVAGTMTVALSSDGNNSSIGETSAQERTFSAEIMQATKDEDYQTFVADGDSAFKRITELQFKAVCVQITPRLKTGYDLVFLGGLKQHGYHVTLWKVAFSDGGDDELLTLSMKNGKIGGALIH
ncbi:MAG TPA: sigma-70 family RNA polymerase sigma factor [Verrucomicrobiae bacterium]